MANWVKWNVRVQHKVVFLWFSLLWDWRMMFYIWILYDAICFFEYWYLVFSSRYSLKYFSLKWYFQPFCEPAFLAPHHGRSWEEDNRTPKPAGNRAYSRSSTNRSDLLNSLVSDTHNTCFVYRKASLEVAKHEVQPQLDGRTLAMDNSGIILSSLVSLSQSKASKEASFTASSPYQRASTRLWSTLTT